MSILKKTGIGFLITLFFILSATKVHATNESGEKIDVKEIVLGHMSDAYDWHITTWGEHHISIPLPVIVKGKHQAGTYLVLLAWLTDKVMKAFSLRKTAEKYMNKSMKRQPQGLSTFQLLKMSYKFG